MAGAVSLHPLLRPLLGAGGAALVSLCLACFFPSALSLGRSVFLQRLAAVTDVAAHCACSTPTFPRNAYHKNDSRLAAIANKQWEDQKARMRDAAKKL